ncbi:MAG: hypothetical protein AAFV29_04660, partial [Myxococcota bacterium]
MSTRPKSRTTRSAKSTRARSSESKSSLSKTSSTRRGRKTTRRTKPRPQTAEAERPESPAVQDMAERLRSLEPGTQRFIVLQSAIDFKRSWVHLAKHLAHVRNAGAYREWGYRTFEAYAQHELNLRRDTCQKLVRSYDFLN